MPTLSYLERRGELETYFDRTAVDAWKRLTSDVPVSGIRKTVRAGRDQMRNTLLSWLPEDLTGARILDAGCGTGALAYEACTAWRRRRRHRPVVDADISRTRSLAGHPRARARRVPRRRLALSRPGPLRSRRGDGQPHPLSRARHGRRIGADWRRARTRASSSPLRHARRCWRRCTPLAAFFRAATGLRRSSRSAGRAWARASRKMRRLHNGGKAASIA